MLPSYSQIVYPFPAPIPIPYGNLPSGNSVRQNITGIRYLCIGCTEGIGLQTALKYKAAGAYVIITGPKSKGKYDADLLNQFDNFMKVEYGQHNSVKRFLDDYYDEYGTRPDAVGDFGLRYSQGSTRHFVPYMEWLLKMYITDKAEMYYGLMNNNAQSTNKTMNLTIAGSTAGIIGNQFLEVYAIGKTFWERWVENFPTYEGRGIYPLVKVSIVMCSYAKTKIVVNSFNPSSDLGEDIHVDFNNTIVATNAAIGNDPAFIASAHYELGTTIDRATNSSMYIVPTSIPAGRGSSDFLYAIRVRDDSVAFTQHMDFGYLQAGLNLSKYIERRATERTQGLILSL